jgi:hypothetical protein
VMTTIPPLKVGSIFVTLIKCAPQSLMVEL